MAYRLTYTANLDWIGPGQGPSVGPSVYGASSGGNAQTLYFGSKAGGQTITGTGTSGAIAAADITTITNAMAADISAQMNAQPAFGQAGGFATGSP